MRRARRNARRLVLRTDRYQPLAAGASAANTEGKGASMPKLFAIASGLALAFAARTAAAEPATCTITKIKDKGVSIDVPVNASIGPEIFCKTHAQSAAKQYAVDNPVCEPGNSRETTFSVTVVYKVDKTEHTHVVKTYCPPAKKRK
jgi:hypothetical protein